METIYTDAEKDGIYKKITKEIWNMVKSSNICAVRIQKPIFERLDQIFSKIADIKCQIQELLLN